MYDANNMHTQLTIILTICIIYKKQKYSLYMLNTNDIDLKKITKIFTNYIYTCKKQKY